jgi:hypothetical protein
VRPHCKAVREPRHSKIIGGKRIHGGRMGTCSGEANFAVAGVRSPPLRCGASLGEGLWGESPETMREAVLSEGRTLCVRIAGPDVGGFPAPDSGIK